MTSGEGREAALLPAPLLAAGPHFFAVGRTCESDSHGFAPPHLPVFLCFACIGTPSHLLVFCVLYAEPQECILQAPCIMLDTALCALTDPFSLRYRSFGPRRRPRPRPMRNARWPRSRSRGGCVALGSWLAVAAAAAVSWALWSVYFTNALPGACVFVFF
jgi:hypothetical protein